MAAQATAPFVIMGLAMYVFHWANNPHKQMKLPPLKPEDKDAVPRQKIFAEKVRDEGHVSVKLRLADRSESHTAVDPVFQGPSVFSTEREKEWNYYDGYEGDPPADHWRREPRLWSDRYKRYIQEVHGIELFKARRPTSHQAGEGDQGEEEEGEKDTEQDQGQEEEDSE